jgi:uncharacterized membrane protein
VRRVYLRHAAILASCTAISAVVIELFSNRLIDAVTAIPLALLLPGAAALLSLDGDRVSIGERLLWTFLASIGISVLGGLGLNLVTGLTRDHWLLFESGVVLVLLCVNLGIGWRSSDSTPPSVPRRNEKSGQRRLFVSASVAILLLAVALSISYVSANHSQERFAQFWLNPTVAQGLQLTSAQLGVQNFEGRTTHFAVSIYKGDSNAPMRRTFTLRDGGTWSMQIKGDAKINLRATLRVAGGDSLQTVRLDALR